VRFSRDVPLKAGVFLLAPLLAAAGQSSVAVSPFVSYVPSAAANPLAGFSLTFGGTTGLALRSGAELAVSTPAPVAAQTGGYRPWGADADAMLFLGGLGGGATVFSRALAPYLFTGLGMTGGDSSGVNVTRHGWSYGVGATIPLGLDADLFSEARWRMNEYVLPTAKDAPDSKSELRFGLSFHVGGGDERRPPPPRRRQRYDDYDDVAVAPAPPPPPPPQTVIVTPAPAPAPTVVVQQAPPPTVVVVSQPEPQPTTQVNVNLPGSIVVGQGGSRSRRPQHVYVQNSSNCTRRGGRTVCVGSPRSTTTTVIQQSRASDGKIEPRRRDQED
jgi:hypothetical protein